MGLLAALSAAFDKLSARAQHRVIPVVDPPRPPGGLCRRCGCDSRSCTEWNCPTPDPNESFSPERMRPCDPGMTGLKTNYAQGGGDLR